MAENYLTVEGIAAALDTATVGGKVDLDVFAQLVRDLRAPPRQSTPALLAVQHPAIAPALKPLIDHPVATLKQLWNAPAALAARPLTMEFLKANDLLGVALYQDISSIDQPPFKKRKKTDMLVTIDNPTYKTAALQRLQGLRQCHMPTGLVAEDRRIIRSFPTDDELTNIINLTNGDQNLLFFLLPVHFLQLRDSLISEWQKHLDCVHDTRDGSYDPCFHDNKIPLPHLLYPTLFGLAQLCRAKATIYTDLIRKLEYERTSTTHCKLARDFPTISDFMETAKFSDMKVSLDFSMGQTYEPRYTSASGRRLKHDVIVLLHTLEIDAGRILFKDRGFRALAYANKEACEEEQIKLKEAMKSDSREECLCALCRNPLIKRGRVQRKTTTAPKSTKTKTAILADKKLNHMMMLEELDGELLLRFFHRHNRLSHLQQNIPTLLRSAPINNQASHH